MQVGKFSIPTQPHAEINIHQDVLAVSQNEEDAALGNEVAIIDRQENNEFELELDDKSDEPEVDLATTNLDDDSNDGK